MSRQLVVVDIETTGLQHNAAILEIAAVNVDTGEEFYFVPYVDGEKFKWAEAKALQINRYFERGVFKDMRSQEETRKYYYPRLRSMLEGNTFGGSNPTFDSARLTMIGNVWHHRLADLAAYAAGVLGIDPTESPGAAKVCEMLGVVNECEHSALEDARATAECFRRLRTRRALQSQGEVPHD